MNTGSSEGAPLTILQVAFPLFTVGRGNGGGAEEILRLIDAGLVAAGHRSIVIAGAGSNVRGELVATPKAETIICDGVRSEAQKRQQRAIESVLKREPIDLIHFHGLDFLSYRTRKAGTPELATLHLPISWYPDDLFSQRDLALNFVSHTQARSYAGKHCLPVISNGIELSNFFVSPEKEDYIAWLGRICPEKGLHIALRVAHRLNSRLLAAGPLHEYEAHRTYFEEEVRPTLDHTRKYLGPLNGRDRAAFLARASCLLAPFLAEETSSLVAMEAIASGTPVVAFRAGALPEIVEHGVTGFLVSSEDEMMEAVQRARAISPEVCRLSAERRFSARCMVDNYINLYRQLVAEGRRCAV